MSHSTLTFSDRMHLHKLSIRQSTTLIANEEARGIHVLHILCTKKGMNRPTNTDNCCVKICACQKSSATEHDVNVSPNRESTSPTSFSEGALCAVRARTWRRNSNLEVCTGKCIRVESFTTVRPSSTHNIQNAPSSAAQRLHGRASTPEQEQIGRILHRIGAPLSPMSTRTYPPSHRA